MASVSNVRINLQTGSDRTVSATWDCSLSHVDHYTVTWHYYTGDGYGYQGDTTDVSQDVKSIKNNSTYSAPSNATHVRCWVKPVSTTHKVNGKDTSYWTGSWTESKEDYYFSNSPPDIPSTPETQMGDSANSDNKYKFTATVDSISDSKTDYIEFYFRKNGTSKVGRVYAKKSLLRCSAYMYVSPGATYAVAARAVNSLSSGSKTKVTLVDGTTATLYAPTYSDWSSYSSEVSPPPDSPSGLSASAFDETTVKLTWTKGSGAEGYEIMYSTKKEYVQNSSSDAQTQTVSENTNTFYLGGLDSGEEWFFKIRSTNSAGNSGWSSIVSTIIGSKPEAPTTWSSTTTAQIGDVVNLYWVHNCEDGSDQSAARIRLVKETGSEEIISISDDTSEYALDTSTYSDGTELTWSVRTAGITGEFGDWSTTRKIKINAPATLALSMDDEMTSFPFYIVAEAGPSTQRAISYYISIYSTEYYETTGPNGQTMHISSGEEIYSKLYNTSNDVLPTVLITLSVGDLTLQDGVTYRAVVTAAMDTGQSIETEEEFTVHWDSELYTPEASVGINFDELTAYINPYCEELVNYEDGDNIDEAERELVEGVTLSVYRREPDGKFTLIGDEVKNDGSATLIDPHPALDYARYRIVARKDDTGQISYEDIPGVPVNQPYIVIQWDEEFSEFDYSGEEEIVDKEWSGSMIKIKGNVDVSESHSPDMELIEYAGRSYPVSYYGTQTGESGVWGCEIPKDDEETIYLLRRLAVYMGDVYVREPSGTGYWAQLTVSMNTNHCDVTVPVSFSINRVEGGA